MLPSTKLFAIYIAILLVIVVGIKADPIGYDPIDYESARNLTADYCYVKSYDEVANIVQECKYIVLESFEVPAGKTLMLSLKKRAVLLFEGVITFGVAHWDGPLMHITGENIQVMGGKNHLLHGQGEKYWDGRGGGGVVKPQRLMSINAQGGSFTDINIKNCPMFCVAIIGNDLTFSGFNIDLQDGFKLLFGGKDTYVTMTVEPPTAFGYMMRGGLGVNTDAMTFVYSNNILIKDSKIWNQDDCVNVLASSNAVIRNVHCWGSHGLSFSSGLSSTDEKNDISNVTFEDCSIGGSLNGIHILTMPTGGRGKISQVTYRNINIIDVILRAIEFRQDYLKEGYPSNNIEIDGLTLENIHGTVTGRDSSAVYINGAGSCKNWNWSGIKITGAQNKNFCNFQPNGFTC